MQQRSVWEFSSSSPPLVAKPRPRRIYVRKLGEERVIIVEEPLPSSIERVLPAKLQTKRKQRTASNVVKEAPVSSNSETEQGESSPELRPLKRTLRCASNGQPEEFASIFDELWNDRQ